MHAHIFCTTLQAPQLGLLVGHVALQQLSKGHLPHAAVSELLQRAGELEGALRGAEDALNTRLTQELNPKVCVI